MATPETGISIRSPWMESLSQTIVLGKTGTPMQEASRNAGLSRGEEAQRESE